MASCSLRAELYVDLLSLSSLDKERPLIPTGDVQKIALFEQAVSIEGFNFYPSVVAILIEKFYKPLYGAPPDEALVTKSLATFEGKLAGYEVILSKQKYLAGDEFTLADLLHLPAGSLLSRSGVDLLESGKFPAIATWWKDISSRPSWKAVLAAQA